MKTLHFETKISAPVDRVWDMMLSDKGYREWTMVFSQGSYFVGDWSKGSSMLFLGPDSTGSKLGGMVSRIVENRQHEYISIEHLGEYSDTYKGIDPNKSKWNGAFENYTFSQNGEGDTVVKVDLDVEDEYEEYFSATWPKALDVLKRIVEHP